MHFARYLLTKGGIIVIGTAMAIFVALTVEFIWYGPDNSVDRFVADFNRNIAEDPIMADVVARDPKFRARAIGQTASAYASGGWPAARDRMSQLMVEKQPDVIWMAVHADDALIVDVWRRYLDTMKKLKDRPASCRLFVTGRSGGVSSLPAAQDEFGAATKAVKAAYLSGVKNLDRGTAPEVPSQANLDELFERYGVSGKPFSLEEWAALRRGLWGQAESDDAAYCAAMIKFHNYVLALPAGEAADAIRAYWGGPLRAKFHADASEAP